MVTSAQSKGDALVHVSLDGFSPQSTSIAVGDAVYWLVDDDQGPYTISNSSGDWLPLYLYDEGDSAGLRFNEAGDYSYYDAFNYNYGVVHVGVGTPNSPPSGTIVSPSDGAVFSAPATFVVSVDAADPDDGVMDVEFYLGDQLVDDVFDPPFSTSIANLTAGQYTVMIVVYDYFGASVAQSITISVQGTATSGPAIASTHLMSGQIQLELTGLTSGKAIVVQGANDLVSPGWSSLQTNMIPASSMVLSIPVTGVTGFFRVVQQP